MCQSRSLERPAVRAFLVSSALSALAEIIVRLSLGRDVDFGEGALESAVDARATAPMSWIVLSSTSEYSDELGRQKLNGSVREVFGLEMTRGRRRPFLDAEWRVSG